MFRNLHKFLTASLALIVLLTACAPTAGVTTDQVKSLEDKVNSLSELKTQVAAYQVEVNAIKENQAVLSVMQTHLDEIQSNLDKLSQQTEMTSANSMTDTVGTSQSAAEDNPFALSVAQFVLDTAGFHGIAESITTTKQIDPSYPGKVNRAYKVLSQTVWPEPLAEQGNAFVTMLKDFATALADNDVEKAITLSDPIHDAQHELSSAIDEWRSTVTTPVSTTADPFSLRMAQYVLDTAGFHGMAESLSTTQKIDAAYPGTVNRTAKILSQTIWPEALNEKGEAFVILLNEFATALKDDKVEDAIKLSDQVHDSQHELSSAIDDWFNTTKDAHTH